MNPHQDPQSILRQIASIRRMERGSLSVIRESAEGPCCNLQRWQDGHNRSEYVPAGQVPLVREHIEAYARFQALVEQYTRLVTEETRAERAAGVKKKRGGRTSLSPGKRRSRR